MIANNNNIQNKRQKLILKMQRKMKYYKNTFLLNKLKHWKKAQKN